LLAAALLDGLFEHPVDTSRRVYELSYFSVLKVPQSCFNSPLEPLAFP